MIRLQNLSLAFGQRQLFDAVSFAIKTGDKVGLVGLNGSGKSTLLKIIAGDQSIDDGIIQLSRGLKIAYLSQDLVLQSTKTILDEAVTAFGDDIALEDVALYESKAKRILMGLGFAQESFAASVDTLSGGWKMRLVLAKLLLQEADFYLFDEPTNHLDIFAKDWFLSFLRQVKAGFIIVCHERYVLDQVCDYILALDHGDAQLFHGNYADYLKQTSEQQEQQRAAYVQQQKMITQKRKTIERFRAKSSKAKMAKSMEKELDKIERIELPADPHKNIVIPQHNILRSGKIVLRVEDVAYSFGKDALFNNVSCVIERGQKVALVAANGVGKTTLFNIIAGIYDVQKGSVTFGHNVSFAFFDQDQNKVLNHANTIWDEVNDAATGRSEKEVRDMLGAFLFSGDDIYKKIGVLSGGEKNRVAMVKVLLQNANFLLLDEPTNHLDMPSKDVLLQALQQYQGTILFISHDHLFLNNLATHIVELTPQGTHTYQGNYDAYLYNKQCIKNEQKGSEQDKNVHKQDQNKQKNVIDNKKLFALKKEISRLERKIATLEKKLVVLQEKIALHTYGSDTYRQLSNQLTAMSAEHKTYIAEWEHIQQKVDG